MILVSARNSKQAISNYTANFSVVPLMKSPLKLSDLINDLTTQLNLTNTE